VVQNDFRRWLTWRRTLGTIWGEVPFELRLDRKKTSLMKIHAEHLKQKKTLVKMAQVGNKLGVLEQKEDQWQLG